MLHLAIFVVRKQQFIKLSIGRIKYWGESWAQEELHHRQRARRSAFGKSKEISKRKVSSNAVQPDKLIFLFHFDMKF